MTHSELRETRELRKEPETQAKPAITQVNSFAHKFRILALLAIGAAGLSSCSAENNKTDRPNIDDVPEILQNNDYGPFKLGVTQNIRSIDGKTSVGIYIQYSLSENAQGVAVTAIGIDGETLYEDELDIPAGDGDLRFVEPYINGTNTAKYEGAGNTALITFKGSAINGEAFEFTVPLTLF